MKCPECNNIEDKVVETRESKDGKYIVNKTTIADIKPVNYFQAVLDSEPKE